MLFTMCFCTHSVYGLEQSSSHSVDAQIVLVPGEHSYITEVIDDKATLIDDGGTEVDFKGKGFDGLNLCMIEITEGDAAFGWIEHELEDEEAEHGDLTNARFYREKHNWILQEAYALIFVDDAGNYVKPDKKYQVVIHAKEDENLTYWQLDSEGDVQELTSDEEQGELKAVGSKAEYFAVVRKVFEGDDTTNPSNKPSDRPNNNSKDPSTIPVGLQKNPYPNGKVSVKTGDETDVFFWLIVGLGTAIGIGIIEKKRKHNK